MDARWLKITRRTGGVGLCAVGVISLAVPFIPGWLLIGVGLYLLLVDSPSARGRFDVFLMRFPRLQRLIRKVLPARGGEGGDTHPRE